MKEKFSGCVQAPAAPTAWGDDLKFYCGSCWGLFLDAGEAPAAESMDPAPTPVAATRIPGPIIARRLEFEGIEFEGIELLR